MPAFAMGPARKRVFRRSVVTVFAICVSAALWGNRKGVTSNDDEFESTLKRRRLLTRDPGTGLSSYQSSGQTYESDGAQLNLRDNLVRLLRSRKFYKYNNFRRRSDEGNPVTVTEKEPDETLREYVGEVVVKNENGNITEIELVDIEEENIPNGGEVDRNANSRKAKENQFGKVSKESRRKEESKDNDEEEEEEESGHKEQGKKKHNEMVNHNTQAESVDRDHVGEHLAVAATTPRPRKGLAGPTPWHKMGAKGQGPPRPIPPTSKSSNESGPTAVPIEEECTTPAYHEFPPDLFTHSQRAHGAVIIHIFVIIYMFYAVAVVCDDYFVASLEECCSRLNLSEDVAGATFMAAGSSTPELFTAILGVLVAKGDVGTGTIVGSAVFNVLFVIGICGIFAGRVVELTWWPLFRDSVFYSGTVIMLIAIIFDSEVTWYESVIMMLNYGLYIVLMKFNNDVHFWVSRRLGIEDDMTQNVGILAQSDKKNYSSYVPFNNEIDECASMPITARYSLQAPPADESIRNNGPSITSMYEAALVLMIRKGFRPMRPVTRFRIAVFMVIVEQRRQKLEANNKMQGQVSIESQDAPKFKSINSSMGLTSEANWKSLPTREEGFERLIKWIIQAPLLAVLHYTIPDCRKDKWRKFFLLTFLSSITWTAIFSYVMVWMVTLVGYTLGIPDSIMGITFLAAGTSVPDAFASLIVARQGQGDMAVSNSLGSNIFDILIGLAFPWFIQTTMVEPGSIATINSRGMVYSVILLFLTIVITIGGIFFSRWQLTPRLGVVLLSIYAVFLLISILLEFNFLGYVNPPMCQD